MPNLLLINGHFPFPSSKGSLTAAFVERALAQAGSHQWDVRQVNVARDWSIESEVENQLWADRILLQFPLNSFGPPWPLKRYLDEVYTAGMDGRLARGDGRSRSDPARQYGSGGEMQDTSYMMSLTMNAPRTIFDISESRLMAGRSLEELLAPLHINFAFFGLSPQPSFAAYDVNKNPDIERDFDRFDSHLKTHLFQSV